MAHFAHVDATGIVDNVISAEQEFIDTRTDKTSWVQTSYNTFGGVHYGTDGKPDGKPALRKNYAGIGFRYDATLDAFIPPQPYPSWVLDEQTCLWQSPVPSPSETDGKFYEWSEDLKQWILINPQEENK